MSILKTKPDLIRHKDHALNKLGTYIDSLINSTSVSDQGRADKLSYWIEDYARLLNKEATFNPQKTIRYKKGDIVKVHLGYRLGSEEGGLHFAVVLDVNNNRNSNTITIVPLTSQKSGKKAHKNSVILNDELFKLIISKHDKLQNDLSNLLHQNCQDIKHMEEEIRRLELDPDDEITPELEEQYHKLLDRTKAIEEDSKYLTEIRKSVLNMKEGSIALVDQITTISKLRIYDPVYSKNVLYGIRLSPSTIESIDDKIAELFIRRKK